MGINFGVIVLQTVLFLLVQATLPLVDMGLFGAMIIAGVTALGRQLHRKAWAVWLEAVRLEATVMLALWLGESPYALGLYLPCRSRWEPGRWGLERLSGAIGSGWEGGSVQS